MHALEEHRRHSGVRLVVCVGTHLFDRDLGNIFCLAVVNYRKNYISGVLERYSLIDIDFFS